MTDQFNTLLGIRRRRSLLRKAGDEQWKGQPEDAVSRTGAPTDQENIAWWRSSSQWKDAPMQRRVAPRVVSLATTSAPMELRAERSLPTTRPRIQAVGIQT